MDTLHRTTSPRLYATMTRRHYCPHSEPFATGDALQTALENGWTLVGRARVEKHGFSSGRSVNVYTVRLHQRGRVLVLRVTETPYVARLLRDHEQAAQRVARGGYRVAVTHHR